MTKKEILKFGPALGLTVALAICSTATADLSGMSFNMVSQYTGSPYWEGEGIYDLGDFTVSNGSEWVGPQENVYDFANGGVVVGWIQHSFDIGADYVEMTTTWMNLEVGDAWTFLSLLPGEFYGYHIHWVGDPDIASASLSVTGNPINMGDLNLYQGKMEAWVDSFIFDPQSDDRITINDVGLDINMQGIAWEYTNIAGNEYSQTSRIEFTFCASDLDGDGEVKVADLLLLIGAWGDCPIPCAADLDGDNDVDVADLLTLIAAWGACP